MEAWPPVSGNLPPWRHGRPSQDKPKFQLAARSAVHTHNLAVYSNLAAFGQAESLNTGGSKNGPRPQKQANRGPKQEK